MLKQIIEKMEHNPKQLFLIDGFGAMLSAFLLGVVLVKLERIFGIPSSALYLLATFPVLFAIYDFYSYQKKSDKLWLFLRGIAIMNLLYCCLSIGLAFYHYEKITALGWSYIITEILIVSILAIIELKVSNQWVGGNTTK